MMERIFERVHSMKRVCLWSLQSYLGKVLRKENKRHAKPEEM